MEGRIVAGVIVVVGLLAIVGVGVYFAYPELLTGKSSTTTMTLTQSSILVSDAQPYFPTGYNSTQLVFSNLSNGDVVSVGQILFRVEFPSNIETRTSTVNGTQTTITVTADYQCGTSMGARRFFHAQLPNGNEMKLDYCLVLNNAVQIAQRAQNMSMNWNLWQISLNTSPTVALHMKGTGENVASAELWVSAYQTTTSTSTVANVNVFGLVNTLGSGTSPSGVVFVNSDTGELYYAPVETGGHYSIYLPNEETYDVITKWVGSYPWQSGEVDSGTLPINMSSGSSMAQSYNIVEQTPNSLVTVDGSIASWQIVTMQPTSVKFTSLDGSNFVANVSSTHSFSIEVPNMMAYVVNIGAQNSTGYTEWYYSHELEVNAGVRVTGLMVDVSL